MSEAQATVIEDTPAAPVEDAPESLLNLTPPEETTEPVAEAETPHLVQDAEPEAAEPAERPEHIPEQFWDPEKGQTDVDKMANAYRELRKKMDSGKHKVPDKYDFSEVEALQSIDAEDPVLVDFLALAKDQGLDQGQFESMTKFYLEAQGEIAEKLETSRVEEMSKLGRNADGIIKSMDAWLMKFHSSKVLNDNELQAIAGASSNAAFISAMNKIRKSYNEPDIPSAATQAEVAPASMADVEEMMRDPKYGSDPAFTQKVERIVYEMHGEKYP
jgi:hypothetical protein